jgi:hypothetical protein
LSVSEGPGPEVPRLKRPPSPLIWKGLLAIGVVARLGAETQASEARELARAEATRTAAEGARRTDSTRLTAAVDSGRALPSDRAWQVDWTLHASSFSIPHDSLHHRVVSLQLDSTARILKRATKDVSLAPTARSVFALVQGPLTAAQERRQGELSRQLGKLDRRLMLQVQRREARARVQAQSLQPTQPTQPRRRRQQTVAPQRTTPSGASALCRDGTYSYSASRSGTCSHHGGVAEWL